MDQSQSCDASNSTNVESSTDISTSPSDKTITEETGPIKNVAPEILERNDASTRPSVSQEDPGSATSTCSPDNEEKTQNLEGISGEKHIAGDCEGIPEEKPSVSSHADQQMDPSNLHYDGDTCIYTDPNSQQQYQWDGTKSEWVARESASSYGFDGDTHTYTDPSDGTVYMWDREKNAWFPKIDDDFMAVYQMNYGFTDPKVAAEEAAKAQKEREEREKMEEEKKMKRKLEPQPATWFEVDKEHNTKVYVTCLPLDITEQEFVDLMQKCGMVMRDIDTNKWKVKLYTEPDNPAQLKGDALCTYIRVESVDMALNLLDGYEIRGKKISVERAKFQMKGSYNPSLKPKKKRKKDKEKLKKHQEKLFDWRPEKMRGERSKNERVVILKNLFDSRDFERDVSLILEYQQDLREECTKCGVVRKVVIYDRHPEGVAQVTFSDPEEADICLKLLNGRWFGQRKITAETWDGKTKYKVVETEAERKARLEKWDKFLELEESKGEGSAKQATKGDVKMSDLEEATGDGAENIQDEDGEGVESGDGDKVKEISNGSG